MNAYRYNKSAGVLFVLAMSDNSDDREHERYYQALLTLDADGVAFGHETLSFTIMLHPDPRRTNPTWRRKYAGLRTLLQARRRLGVLVTPSLVMRGALRVMGWLQPPPPEERLEVASTFGEGARWVEAQGRPLRALLEKYLAEACAELNLSRERMPALAG
jgi:hypothetical protein